ncbi:crustacean hyperglycemic hormone 1 precursor [Penaeus vannamei]|uniref:Crustacean hyperglycemic hormone 1 n=1 Tax=Penaeus vannamei TaxID=6689 RepID=A0A3R7Q979_PENVA|nr:crustacean hyperglycemic hormone 1 precursor [Penaeus vannamei]
MKDADDRLYKATSTWLRRRADEEPRSRRFSPPDSSRRRGNDWGSTGAFSCPGIPAASVPASVLASWDGNEIPPSLPSSSESSPATSLAGAQTANKRSISFDSCTGVYDRELLVRLDRVCEDCYNLYRDTDVASNAEQTKSLEVAGSLLPIRVDAEEMIGVRLVRSAVLVSLLLVFPASVLASWDGNEIPPSLPSSSESSPATSSREPRPQTSAAYPSTRARASTTANSLSNCFHNEVFLYCVDYMYRPRQRNQYRAALQRLGK